jgi:hypothetical protein
MVAAFRQLQLLKRLPAGIARCQATLSIAGGITTTMQL